MYGMKGEKLDRREESQLSRKEQTTMGRLRNGHHPEVKYCLHKIGRAVDTICRKYGIGEVTAEHAVYDCPRFYHPQHEPTPPDTLVKDPHKVLRRWEKWSPVPDLPDVQQSGITTAYSSRPAPPHHFAHPSQYFTKPNCPSVHPRPFHPISPQLPTRVCTTTPTTTSPAVCIKITSRGLQLV